MRFDPASKVFELSVRELAEHAVARRIGFGAGEGWGRFGLGSQLHARVLEERQKKVPHYQGEVCVQSKVAVGDWTAIISGRLDGCYQNAPGAWLVEEFKSCFLGNDHPRAENDRHRQQLLIYCYLWHELGHTPVAGQLVYVDIATGRESCVPVRFDAEEQSEWLRRSLERLLEDWQAQQLIRERKAEVAGRLPFPHAAPRPGQQTLIEAIRTAVIQGEHLLAEAPTGSGKTAASLYPAVAEGLKTGRQVLFLTAKTLQQKMAIGALAAMNRDGAFRTLQLRAKEKMCANDQVICHEDFCPYAKNYPAKMERSNLLGRLRESQSHHDPDAVFREARSEKVCPFEVQLELAAGADVVVGDYNYVFEPGTALRHLEDLGETILVIDEAHNLPDRARQIFSPELHEDIFRNAAEHVRKLVVRGNVPAQKVRNWRKKGTSEHAQIALFDPPVRASSAQFQESMLTLLDRIVEILRGCAASVLTHGRLIAEVEPPRDALRAWWQEWEMTAIAYLGWKRDNQVAAPEDPVMEAHFAVQRFVSVLNFYGAGFNCVVDRQVTATRSGLRLALVCLDPSRALRSVFNSVSSSTLLSATLRPQEKVMRVLGLDDRRTSSITLPPPFPRENRRILVVPAVKTTFAERVRNFPHIATLIADLAEAVPGNVLVLFPSYEFLRQVVQVLPATTRRLMTQRPNASESERHQLLEALGNSTQQRVLLFAVVGGMFAEGVDYAGDLLSGVFVVSPSLPQVSFERELLRRYFDEQEGSGFEYAYLQPGMTRVVQAAGRLIRTETDRGVIVLICQRFLQEPYTGYMPRDWFGEHPVELVSDNPVREIHRFFGESLSG